MKPKGKQLEEFVAMVEQILLPTGFEVKINEVSRDEDGVPVAEFDVRIIGKVGSTNFAWLIECRDRPSAGPAPSSWIEQLYARRDRFNFNKVTAVSTTGFAKPAKIYAENKGIELREVVSLDPKEFEWLGIKSMTVIQSLASLEHADILINPEEHDQYGEALVRLLATAKGSDKILRKSKTGEVCTVADAYLGVFENLPPEQKEPYNRLNANTPPLALNVHANYPTDDHFIIDTDVGPVNVTAIKFRGSISVREQIIPLQETTEYRHTGTGDIISQIATFVPHTVLGREVTIEMHRIGKNGETHIILKAENKKSQEQ